MFKFQKDKKRGQTSMEFLAIFTLLIAALVTMSYVSFQKSSSLIDYKKNYEADIFLEKFGDKINLVYLEGHGFSMNATLPERILGYTYTLDLEKNQLRLNAFNQTYTKLLITENIIGMFQFGLNKIRNSNNVVVITQ